MSPLNLAQILDSEDTYWGGLEFGGHVTCAGSWIAVCCEYWVDDGSGDCIGAVFMCQMESGQLVVKQKLLAPLADRLDIAGFGSWAGMNPAATELMVGANFYYPSPEQGGRVYRFVLTAGTWALHATQPKIQRYDWSSGQEDYFGNTGAFDGTHLAVYWDPYCAGGVRYSGAIDMLEKTGDTWGFVQRLQPSDQVQSRSFGQSYCGHVTTISLDGNQMAVLASGSTTYNDQVYIFEKSGTWAETAPILVPTPTQKSYGSVLLRGSTLLVGGVWLPGTSEYGCVYLFKKSGTWGQTDYVLPPVEYQACDAWFGISLALSYDGSLVVVGGKNAYIPPDGHYYDGALFLYDLVDDALESSETLYPEVPAELGGFQVCLWPVGEDHTHIIAGAYTYGVVNSGGVFLYEWTDDPNWSYELAGTNPGNALNWPQMPSTGSSGLDFTGGAEDVAWFSGDGAEGFADASWGYATWTLAGEYAEFGGALDADGFEYGWANWLARFDFDEDDLALGPTETFESGWNNTRVLDLVATDEHVDGFETGWSTSHVNNMTDSATANFVGGASYESCDTWTTLMQ